MPFLASVGVLLDFGIGDNFDDAALDEFLEADGDHGDLADLLADCAEFDGADVGLFELLFGLDDALLDVDVVGLLLVVHKRHKFGAVSHELKL
jgi:hypothetical protein